MAAQSLIHNAEVYGSAVASRLRKLPVSVWRSIVIALALLWMVHNVARLVWVFISAPELGVPPVIAIQAVRGSEQVSSYNVDLSAMQAEQIFGASVAEPETLAEPVQTQVEDDVEKTSLNLKLVGLLASNDQSQASATIANGNNQDIYEINDTLPVGNNVKLAKVLSDRVILNNNGNYEALWLYSEADFNVRYSASAAPNRRVVEDDAAEDVDVERIETSVKPSDVPESISDVVRFSVHREEGQMVGFRIRPGKDREFFEQLGLEANDIVTSVNGIAIDNPQAIRDNYQQLKSATSADLEIKRGDEMVYINVTLDTLSE